MLTRNKLSRLQAILLLCLSPLLWQSTFGQDTSAAKLQQWVAENNVAAIRALGPPVLPKLVQLYEDARNDELKARVAQTLYALSWKSPQAKLALMKDVHTLNQNLRLQVQWALGRVSNDQDVVDTLFASMRSDSNPLFRDKAACALAYDQIHLTEKQKVRLFDLLIEALGDDKLDVRTIALLALQIHTGQTKGFNPNSSLTEREQKIRLWRQWLAQYKSGL
jgi:HEAT repeat protein